MCEIKHPIFLERNGLPFHIFIQHLNRLDDEGVSIKFEVACLNRVTDCINRF